MFPAGSRAAVMENQSLFRREPLEKLFSLLSPAELSAQIKHGWQNTKKHIWSVSITLRWRHSVIGCPNQSDRRSLPSHQMGQEDQHLLGDLLDPLVPQDHLLLEVLVIQSLPGHHREYKAHTLDVLPLKHDAEDPLLTLGVNTHT